MTDPQAKQVASLLRQLADVFDAAAPEPEPIPEPPPVPPPPLPPAPVPSDLADWLAWQVDAATVWTPIQLVSGDWSSEETWERPALKTSGVRATFTADPQPAYDADLPGGADPPPWDGVPPWRQQIEEANARRTRVP